VITLRITNALPGKAHAAVEVRLDRTEVDYFTHYTPPDVYPVCAFGVVNTWQGRIHNADGLNYLVKIADSARGKPHAITSHVTPVPLPPVCS